MPGWERNQETTFEKSSWEVRSARGLTDFVGRRAELETLLAHAAGARRGSGGVVVLTGEAGIGKSRLCRELAALAERRGLQVVVQSAASSDVPSPLRLIGRWLRTCQS